MGAQRTFVVDIKIKSRGLVGEKSESERQHTGACEHVEKVMNDRCKGSAKRMNSSS
jgi:hypothetical protein